MDETTSPVNPSVTTSVSVKALVPATKPPAQLSKKERLLQKQKELDDLDAILNEFKTTTVSAESASAVQVTAVCASIESSNVDDGKDDSKKKKKKKKVPAVNESKATGELPAAGGIVDEPVGTAVAISSPAEVAALLKSKQLASKKSKSSSASDVQKIALAEIQKASVGTSDSKKDKKKKDKTRYNEMPNL